MTLNAAGYTVGSNQPLNHARILWDPIAGAVTADGADGDLAQNDYTFQRWQPSAGAASWVIQTDADAQVDCVFIAAHNLSGATVTIGTSAATSGGFTTRATIAPADNSTIAVLFNTGAGAAHTIRRVSVAIDDGTDRTVGIIRAGVALQMTQPFWAGHRPLVMSRQTETEQTLSETGQWLGRTVKRLAQKAEYGWEHLKLDWYSANFDPFAQVLPGRPFGIVGNPARLGAADVGWCWTDRDVTPQIMALKSYVAVGLPVTGFV